MIWAVLLLPLYLEGFRLTVRTYHDELEWIINLTDSTGKLARWRLRLPEFEFYTVHFAVNKHQSIDALLRLESIGTDHLPIDDDIPVLYITPSNLE